MTDVDVDLDTVMPVGAVLYPYVRTVIVTDRYSVGPLVSTAEGLEGVLVANGKVVYVDGRRAGDVEEIRAVPTNGGLNEYRITVVP